MEAETAPRQASVSHGMTSAQKRILAVLVLGTLMSAVDVTIVLLAIASITHALNTNLATSIWIIIAYLLVVAIFTTQLGRLGDMYGRGKIFNLGFLIFTVGSVLCGASTSIYMLIAFRILQGLGGSMIQANSGAIIADTFDRQSRGKAYGYTAMGWSTGSMLGIVLGGILTTFVGWQYIFYINIPIGAVALWFGLRYIKDDTSIKEPIDFKGMFVLSAMLILLTFSATEIVSVGASAIGLAMFAIGVLFIPIFVWVEKHEKYPIIDFSAFSNKILAHSLGAAFLQGSGYLAIVFILIMYLQGVRGLNPLNASILLIPGYIVGGIAGPSMGRLSDKIGARTVATVGIILTLLTILIYYVMLDATTPYWIIIAATIMAGIGTSMFFPANSSAVMANAPSNNYGVASGLLRSLSNIGSLVSYLLTITVASLAVSREQAFKIFLGTSDLIGNISAEFLKSMHAVFIISAIILIAAAALSWTRGSEHRQEWTHSKQHVKQQS